MTEFHVGQPGLVWCVPLALAVPDIPTGRRRRMKGDRCQNASQLLLASARLDPGSVAAWQRSGAAQETSTSLGG